MTQSKLGFIPDPITVAFDKLLPSRKAPDGLISSRKFKQIISSIDAIGLIEPLTIAKADKTSSINRLSTIQEHFMIRRAVDRGVTPTRLAKSLELDLEHITKKINLLDGICAEAVRLLRDKHFSANLSPVLRKLKPTRQVECVELMVDTNNITVSYAQALLAATPPNMLVNEGGPKKVKGVTADQMAKMEREMANLESQFKLVEQSYGQDVLNLVLARGYLTKLLDNEAVIRFLSQNNPDILREFSGIVQGTALDK